MLRDVLWTEVHALWLFLNSRKKIQRGIFPSLKILYRIELKITLFYLFLENFVQASKNLAKYDAVWFQEDSEK